MNISTFFAHHVIPYTLNELFHLALPCDGIQSIRSSNETFKLRCKESTQPQCLYRHGYNLGLLSQEIQRVHTITQTCTSNSPTCIPLVVAYHSATHSISSIFHKHIYILSSSQLCATMFKYIPLVTFLRTNKLEIHKVDLPFGTRPCD